MKKFFSLLVLGFLVITLFSCKDDDNFEDHDTYSVVADATGTFDSSNNFTLIKDIDIFDSDVVLVYRNTNSNTNSAPVWQFIPKTYYLSGGRELDYNFDFTTKDIQIYTQANFDQNTMSAEEKNQYLINQTFRMVLVPASYGKNANVDYNDYNSVIKYFNIDDSKIKTL